MTSSASSMTIYSFLCSLLPYFLTNAQSAGGEGYTSIFAFGDSLTDNGNSVGFAAPKITHQARLPNGETYFHRPTGRCCDGRLIIDFLAQSFGLPLPPPYVEFMEGKVKDIHAGVNFAVSGAKALEDASQNYLTLKAQLRWFKDILPSFYSQNPNRTEPLQSSLVVLGSIGGNDYRDALFFGESMARTLYRAHLVTRYIASAVTELIELGVRTVMVPGVIPDGCLTINLKYFGGYNKANYDEFGCIKSLNYLAEYHNELLQMKLDLARKRHPNATIIFADYYNAALQLYRDPEKFGFINIKDACCGAGGPFNYDISVQCGEPETAACPDPSVYVNWDGPHFTEAANRWIALALLEGPYTIPKINASCISDVATSTLV